MSRTNSHFLGASVQEFLQIWALSGDATLNLTTSGGQANIEFKCTLGHPGAPHTLPPSAPPSAPPPAPHRPRHRGPAEREKNRLRAARHQAARAKSTVPVSSSVSASVSVADSAECSTAPVVSVTTALEDHEAGSSPDLKCEQCEYTNNTSKGLGQHVRMKHRISQVDGVIDSDEETIKESVPVNISEVTKTFQIYVEGLNKGEIQDELDSIWDDNNVNGVDVKKELENFSVKVSCWEFTEDFTASSAASLLESLSWPEFFSITSSQPTRYLNSLEFFTK